MGTSHPETKPWIMEKAMRARVKTILDVGAGSGTYRNYFYRNGYTPIMDAVEVWEPYIQEFSLKNKYRKVYKEDVRSFTKYNHDLVIFGDILEHMTQEDAFNVWTKASKKCKYGVISIPIIEYHQHAINGNPYEEHVKEDWDHKQVMESFPGIQDYWLGGITGAYWAKFDV
jgi:2-polyprenyl-3-methyl-5-hydroxy-6-metoxy-1,4-benzoquinol methylase